MGSKKALQGARRAAVLDLLGGRCACCGEDHPEFLTLDHRNGGGNEHRRQRCYNAALIYKDVLADPDAKAHYRILCWNCNCAIGLHGVCPHERERAGRST